ncbi:hypothetical protein COLO4_32040 [Corchorus olitorius]|uniref:Uncharacterized protein n=1 Tax=Corchorus olitorius TaxID=93759 RepID=A0A1R3H2A2_9ROSI|nr:hypothetical protein COLO4_32040 [Corchorus olitorius]
MVPLLPPWLGPCRVAVTAACCHGLARPSPLAVG